LDFIFSPFLHDLFSRYCSTGLLLVAIYLFDPVSFTLQFHGSNVSHLFHEPKPGRRGYSAFFLVFFLWTPPLSSVSYGSTMGPVFFFSLFYGPFSHDHFPLTEF